MNRSHFLLVPLLAFVFNAQAQTAQKPGPTAAPGTVVTATATASTTAADLKRIHEEQARRWSLTVEDWTRFEEIKAGPRGYWSPNIDPLTALGVEARNDGERRRYAEIQVRMEAARAERELAYQRAYDDAFKRIFPGILPIANAVRHGSTGGVSRVPRESVSERLALFVRTVDCPQCLRQAKTLQDSGKEVDIYVLGTLNKDEAIRTWARQAGIKPELVQKKQITLNHDNGAWKSIGGGKGDLPAVFQRTANGQWARAK